MTREFTLSDLQKLLAQAESRLAALMQRRYSVLAALAEKMFLPEHVLPD